MITKNIVFAGIIILIVGLMGSFVLSQQSAIEATVCCEQTTSGAFCQNVPAAECASGSRQVPTSCGATSFCRSGTCYDSSEGICMDNTPQLVCNNAGGVWNAESPPQCNLGCCVLGDQAAFVSLVRCKKLSATLGLKTNYDTSTTNEVACIAKVQQQEKGACVYEFEFEKTCKFTTRAECSGSTQGGVNGTVSSGTFYAGKLCSAEELGTNCGLSSKTTCVAGKDEVYFVDTCGNPANIYDASKVNDKSYWTDVKTKDESCGPGGANAGSASCGNCNYLEGSICRSETVAGRNPTYGDFICADLNCRNTQNGKDYKHGESWCVYNDEGKFGNSDNTVGSRFYKHICINSEEVLEQCEDFRAEECIEETANDFTQAACKVNRWQDCTSQTEQLDCENEDKRDCVWKPDLELPGVNTTDEDDNDVGACFPENKPGFNFWSDTETTGLCSQANDLCVVTFEEGLFGGEECTDNCECLSDKWEKQKVQACMSLGDCGPALNWIGVRGYKGGYNISIEDLDEEED